MKLYNSEGQRIFPELKVEITITGTTSIQDLEHVYREILSGEWSDIQKLLILVSSETKSELIDRDSKSCLLRKIFVKLP